MVLVVVIVLNLLLVALLVMVELGRSLGALVAGMAQLDLLIGMAQVDLAIEMALDALAAGMALMVLVVGMSLVAWVDVWVLVASVEGRVPVASADGRVLVVLVDGRVLEDLADGRVLGPVASVGEGAVGLMGLAGEVEEVLADLVAGVILLVLVDVGGVILVDEAVVIFLVGVVEEGVDLEGGDVLTEAHMIVLSQMDAEDLMIVEDLVTRVGAGATAVAQIEAAREAMTEEVIAGA